MTVPPGNEPDFTAEDLDAMRAARARASWRRGLYRIGFKTVLLGLLGAGGWFAYKTHQNRIPSPSRPPERRVSERRSVASETGVSQSAQKPAAQDTPTPAPQVHDDDWRIRRIAQLEEIRRREEKALERRVTAMYGSGDLQGKPMKLHYEFSDPIALELTPNVGRQIAGWRELSRTLEALVMTYRREVVYRVERRPSGLVLVYDPDASRNKQGLMRNLVQVDKNSYEFNLDWRITNATVEGTTYSYVADEPRIVLNTFEEALRKREPETRAMKEYEADGAKRAHAWARDELVTQHHTPDILQFKDIAHRALEPTEPMPVNEREEFRVDLDR